MNETVNTTIDTLATKLAEAALTILVKTCRHEAAAASRDILESACAAMRAQAKPVLDRLWDAIMENPPEAEAAFKAATLELAQAGIAVLRKA